MKKHAMFVTISPALVVLASCTGMQKGITEARLIREAIAHNCGAKMITDSCGKTSWSPDGTRIAFGKAKANRGLRMGGIQILDLGSGKTTNITDRGKDPAWSPDGRYIAYVIESAANGGEEVWLVGSDGAEPHRISEGGYPGWSGDGKTLYFHSREQRKILAYQPDRPDNNPAVFCDGSRSGYPAVSPDGQLVAFGEFRNGLVIVDRNTGKEVAAWPISGTWGLLPAWSPGSKQVAFGGFNGDTMGLWVFSLESKSASRLVNGCFTVPAWSHDGKKLSFDMRLGNDPLQWEIWALEIPPVVTSQPDPG